MFCFFSELDKAIEVFKQLLIIDPYRLDNLDTYSNLLYVKELNTQLADLAHKAVSIDKYRVETCCVIGTPNFQHKTTFSKHKNSRELLQFTFRPCQSCSIFQKGVKTQP